MDKYVSTPSVCSVLSAAGRHALKGLWGPCSGPWEMEVAVKPLQCQEGLSPHIPAQGVLMSAKS